jgi:oligo-alginate lyase
VENAIRSPRPGGGKSGSNCLLASTSMPDGRQSHDTWWRCNMHRAVWLLAGFILFLIVAVLSHWAATGPNFYFGDRYYADAAKARPRAWPPHPRLIVTSNDWALLESRRAADPRLDTLVRALLQNARDLLSQPLLHRNFTGRRLLFVSRSFIKRTLLWSFAYRLTAQRTYLNRARSEMLHVAEFVDWNPKHFLDVAEMAAGFAIAYDWLFHDLSSVDRRILREALVRHSLVHAQNGHHTYNMTNNWGQVCMGGMVLGALAVGDDDPALAMSLLAAARRDAPVAMRPYAPDGVYPEGPWYWVYGTTYEVLLISALRSALGTDWGLMTRPGFLRSAEFYAQTIGPTGLHFNFSDSEETAPLVPPLLFLAREQRRPELASALLPFSRELHSKRERVSDLYTPLAVFWWPFHVATRSNKTLPLHFTGKGQNPLAIWRSSWNETQAFYFAIKGGRAAAAHGHMDAGSFVMDLDGIRWALDLGRQDYESLESRGISFWRMNQDSQRWTVFRLNNHAHNTLTLNGGLHNAAGIADLKRTGPYEVTINMTDIFLPGQVRRASRHAKVEGMTVSLHDVIVGAHEGTEVCWIMLTHANVTLRENVAHLTSEDKALQLTFMGQGVRLNVEDAWAPRSAHDARNPGLRRLLARSRINSTGNWQLNVVLARPPPVLKRYT